MNHPVAKVVSVAALIWLPAAILLSLACWRWRLGVQPVFDLTNLFVVIVATFIAYGQLAALVDQQRRDYVRTLRDHALTYSFDNRMDLVEGLLALRNEFERGMRDGRVPLEEMVQDGGAWKKPVSTLVLLFAHWENLALTIYSGTTDERMAFERCARNLVTYVDRYRSFIDHRREENPRMYIYLTMLADRWRGEAFANTRPIFDLGRGQRSDRARSD